MSSKRIDDTEVCEYHYGTQTLLTSIDTKLTWLIRIIGGTIVILFLPTVVYMAKLEKRVTSLEDKIARLIVQRNTDHKDQKFIP